MRDDPSLKYSILTFGCQMNVRDSEIMAGLLEGRGYTPAASLEDADVIVVNTCCVRETAERRIMGRLGDLKRLKDRKAHLVIAVGGCMTQQQEIAERIRTKLPHVDLVFGTFNMRELPDLVDAVRSGGGRVFDVWTCERPEAGPQPFVRGRGVTAYVTIMHGCNNFCSYCIVPYVRGRERSRKADDVVSEVKDAVSAGFKEIMLLGQNVNSYGKDAGDDRGFSSLLSTLDSVRGIERIRYMTSHPKDFSQDIIDAVASSRHVCEHFHLPVQAGADKVLQAMNRGYTRDRYMDLIERVRMAAPGASVTTDIIVGFPGETERDFEDTLDLVRTVRFDMAYTFMYSPRSGTSAAAMPGQVPIEERRRRLAALTREINPIALRINQGLVGSSVEVLVEGPSEKDPAVSMGRTKTNKVVLIPGEVARNSLVEVGIVKARTWTLESSLPGKPSSPPGLS